MERTNGQGHALDEQQTSAAKRANGAPVLPPASVERSKKHYRLQQAVQLALEPHVAVKHHVALVKRGSRSFTTSNGNGNGNGSGKKRKKRGSGSAIDDLANVEYETKPLPPDLPKVPDIVKSMPRRKFALKRTSEDMGYNIVPNIRLRASALQTIGRFFVWFRSAFICLMGILSDKMKGEDKPQRRAERLVAAMQMIGGTLIKVGQQLAMRVDVLPYVYCRELSKLLDSVKPFPVNQAIESIEATLGKPLNEIFSEFDPVPIGSASIGCVYQAKLLNGDKVAVKVRRPDVERRFAADIQAVKWLIAVLDALTITRAGLMKNFVVDFELSLTEELDFRKEARYQDLFRRAARKKKNTRRTNWITAPRVYFEHSGHNIIVQEFTSGMWAWEMVAAIEQKDEAGLARMRQLNIDPKVVAKRLIWTAYWGVLTNLVFHADPHPANIVVQENNKLVFIDFGACGSISSSRRRLQQEMFYHQQQDDIHGMVQAALQLLAPLPHLEVHELEGDIENALREAMYGQKSKRSPWYERTSAAMWMKIFEVTRKYQMPANINTVRMFRANMLYDSLAMRLHNDVRPWNEYKSYSKDAQAVVKKRLTRTMKKRMKKGLSGRDYMTIEQLMQTGQRAFFKLNSFLGKRLPDFSYMVEKSVFAFMVVLRFAVTLIAVVSIGVGGVAFRAYLNNQPVSVGPIFRQVIMNGWLQGLLVVLVLLDVRRIMSRFGDRDVG